jgi:hypothetical protein
MGAKYGRITAPFRKSKLVNQAVRAKNIILSSAPYIKKVP